jgi:DNA polymerase
VYDILNAGPTHRFVVSGKLVSNCGYQGGVGAFVTMSAGYNMDLERMADAVLPTAPVRIRSEANRAWSYARIKRKTHNLPEKIFLACDILKRLWREAHPAISGMWGDMESAARSAVLTPNTVFHAGRIAFSGHKQWLLAKLPSGRVLCYYRPEVDEGGKLSYWGMNSVTRKFCKQRAYGGLLLENACQSASRDVLADAMPTAEKLNYKIVLTVHDELVTETPDTGEYSVDRLSAILATNPPWALGLPLAAAGFETKRYRKE